LNILQFLVKFRSIAENPEIINAEYPALVLGFLVFFRQAAGILLKLRWNFGIIGLKFAGVVRWSAFGKSQVRRASFL
jgi:hypothetical protein